MRIDKIKKLKSGKYKLFIDNNEEIITHGDVILKNNLLSEVKISRDLLLKITTDTEYYNIYNQVVNYIQRRLRSNKEVILYLKRNKVKEVVQKRIINDLKNNNLINDYAFAKAFVADKVHLVKMGPFKIKKELSYHEIDDNIIEKLLSEIDPNLIYENLSALISKKVSANKRNSKYQLKNKILYECLERGYDKDLINDLFEKLYITDNKIIKNEFDKLYNKLKKKEQEEKLFLIIKQKLYQKGFSTEEIDSLFLKKGK